MQNFMGSVFGRQMAAASFASAVTSAGASVTSAMSSGGGGGGGGGAIAFDKYNWPVEHEYGSIIHFDLLELKEKRSAGIHFLVQGAYRLVPAAGVICCVNFLTACVMAGADGGRGVYSIANIFFSLLWALVMPGVAMAFTYKLYRGLAEPNTVSLMTAKVRLCEARAKLATGCFATRVASLPSPLSASRLMPPPPPPPPGPRRTPCPSLIHSRHLYLR